MFSRLMLVFFLLFLPLVVSCGGEPLTKCEAAFADAAAKSEYEDSVNDLNQAFIDCQTEDEFVAASEKFPDALDGVSPIVFIDNRCEFGPFNKQNSLCGSR